MIFFLHCSAPLLDNFTFFYCDNHAKNKNRKRKLRTSFPATFQEVFIVLPTHFVAVSCPEITLVSSPELTSTPYGHLALAGQRLFKVRQL